MTTTTRPEHAPTTTRARRPVPAQIARRIADTPALWRPLVRFDAAARFATRLPAASDDHEVWLLTWLPGQGTEWHDHGGSAGAFATVQGVLTEQHAIRTRAAVPPWIVPGARRLVTGGVRPFGPRHVHHVVNADPVGRREHPRLRPVADRDDGVHAARIAATFVGLATGRGELVSVLIPPATTTRTGRRTIHDVLESARGRLARLTPAQARIRWSAGAVVVDIRPAAQRAAEGELPGALVVERNVLEWRFDPMSDAALPIASYDLEVLVLCQEGYTSSLAAAALQDLGLHRATDVIGGYAAWRELL